MAAEKEAVVRLQVALTDERRRCGEVERELAAIRRAFEEAGLLESAARRGPHACVDGMRSLRQELQTLQCVDPRCCMRIARRTPAA